MRTVEREVGSLLRVSARVPGLAPWRFLRSVRGEPRGFWARGDEWIAHSGALLSLEVSDEAGGTSSRFETIRREARAVQAALHPTSARDGLPPPRFFGGFSFTPRHRASEAWSGFPSARFVLPSVEVIGAPDGALVVLQDLRPSEEGVEERERALRDHLETFLARLARNGKEADLEADAAPCAPTGSALGSDPETLAARDRSGWGPWREAVEEVLGSIRTGLVSKVVLARTLDVDLGSTVSPLDVARRLRAAHRRSHVFLFEPAPGRAFVGAAPETVATLHGPAFEATAVAGSAPMGASEAEAAAHAGRLMSSEKDRREHRLTVEEMLRCLRPVVEELEAEEEPHVLRLPGIQHLETRVRARAGKTADVLSLLSAVHPTPAVCGLPRDAALELIRAEEPFERGWYAGPVGWFDLEGDGIFAPALRSALHRDGHWRLFAGAGLVRGSRPEAEWEETGMKFAPVLRALGAGARP